MASPVEAIVLLCDAAVADPLGGKIHMLGAGWSVTTSPTGAAAVAVMLKIPWDRTNQKLPTSLAMLDADGQLVTLPDGTAVRSAQTIEVGRPPGLDPGSMIEASFSLSLPPLPLPPGRYQWRLEVAGEVVQTVSFQVRAPQAGGFPAP